MIWEIGGGESAKRPDITDGSPPSLSAQTGKFWQLVEDRGRNQVMGRANRRGNPVDQRSYRCSYVFGIWQGWPTLISAGADLKLKQWDVSSGKEGKPIQPPPSPAHSLTLSPDGKQLLVWQVVKGSNIVEAYDMEDVTGHAFEAIRARQ